jgi:hypothetical protein
LKTRDSFWIREPGYERGRVLMHPARPIKNRSLLNICGIFLENILMPNFIQINSLSNKADDNNENKQHANQIIQITHQGFKLFCKGNVSKFQILQKCAVRHCSSVQRSNFKRVPYNTPTVPCGTWGVPCGTVSFTNSSNFGFST